MLETSEAIVKLLWEYSPDTMEELRHLETGMEAYPNVDPDWVWVVEGEDGKIAASLFAAPAHGTAILLRLNARDGANPYLVRRLLRAVLQSLKDRGYSMFFSFLDATKVDELKLARIAQRYGCQIVSFSGYIACGRIK